MRLAGLVVADTLTRCAEAVRPGITTLELDAIAEASIRDAGAIPSFLGYHGFPGSICVSVNEEIVHGIPGSRVLEEGDLVSIDCGAIISGWHGDAALSVGVGQISPELERLSNIAQAGLWAGIAASKPGATLGDVGAAVQATVEASGAGYGNVVDYVGHGIGTAMHMPPNVPNIGKAGKGPILQVGMAIAIEPMITLGTAESEVLADDWTVVTQDHKPAAHWEHTVAITQGGPWVLTAHDGGAARLGSNGQM